MWLSVSAHAFITGLILDCLQILQLGFNLPELGLASVNPP